ncbi:MAG: mechanosensitive ion channel family protein [Bacteroidales bacterium]|nr:mechanosensitive ion channel family protein [Bacteroidales bacterium]
MLFLDAVPKAENAPSDLINGIIQWCAQNGMTAVQKILIALVALWVGFKIIKFLKNKLKKAFDKNNLDPTLRPVILSIVSIGLKILLIIALIGYLGIPMTSFVAILGAAGLAVGMALSGTIQNVAGGIVILVFRPFKLGDYIATQGMEGTVTSIKIFSTVINTVDNKVITLPNGTLSGGNITNYSAMETRRISVYSVMAVGVDVEAVKAGIRSLVEANDKILREPDYDLVTIINNGSVTLETRVWCKTSDYWPVNDYLNREIYNYLRRENIPAPYTKVDIMK